MTRPHVAVGTAAVSEGTLVKRLLLPAVIALLFAMAAPADAQPLEHENYSGTDSFDTDCETATGDVFDLHVDVTFSGVFLLKAAGEAGAPPRLFDNYSAVETITAEGSDRVLTVEHNGLYKDLHITQVEGTVYQFVSIESGQPFVVYSDTGEVLIRDRGLLKTTFQVDTLGDTDPENDVFIEGSFSVLADNGAHPGFYFDFCGFLQEYFFG
jgi:hypothetical protein